MYGKDYRMNSSNLFTTDILEAAFSHSIGKQWNLVHQAQYFSRIYTGVATKGGLGSGNTIQGQIKANYLYLGTGFEKYWGNKFQFYVAGGIQLGIRVHSGLNIFSYQYGPPSTYNDKPIARDQLIHPVTLRAPVSFGLRYQLPYNVSISARYQIAPEFTHLGDYIGDILPISQSIHFGLTYRLN